MRNTHALTQWLRQLKAAILLLYLDIFDSDNCAGRRKRALLIQKVILNTRRILAARTLLRAYSAPQAPSQAHQSLPLPPHPNKLTYHTLARKCRSCRGHNSRGPNADLLQSCIKIQVAGGRAAIMNEQVMQVGVICCERSLRQHSYARI